MNYPMQSSGLAGLNTVQNMSDRNMAETLMANGGQRFSRGGISNIQRMATGGVPKYTYDAITGKYTLADDSILALSSDSVPKYIYDPITQRYTLDTSEEKKKKDEDSETAPDGGPGDAPGGGGPGGGPGGGIPGGGTGNTNPGFFSTVMNVVSALFGQPTGSQLPAPVESRGTALTSVPYESGYVPGTGVVVGGAIQDGKTETTSLGPLGGDSGGGPSLGDSYGPGSVADTGDVSGQSEGTPAIANGGLLALAQGGMYNLGDYSDGGRLLRGPGDGVSDGIPAIIANKQPARLADGEFVVPARIVSELGNGSTEAGARKLYQMLARVQNARKKSIGEGRVAVNSRADKMLPA